MDERQIIKALRNRDPRGITAVYDRYAEGLYDYCWWLLRDHGTAREALQDALLATGVHVDALRSPERLRPWLYALIRSECLRRSPATPRTDADTAPDTTELRLLAWKATEAVPPTESEVLELHERHGIDGTDVATILRRPAEEVARLLEAARTRIAQALRAEMLAHAGPSGCTQLAELLREADEGHVAHCRERVDRHARDCTTCAERVPRRVSVSRFMGLLPTASAPADLRPRVVEAYADPALLEYRLLAARRLQPLGRDGFPAASRKGRPGRPASGGAAALAAAGGLVAATLCAAAGVALLRYTPVADDARAGTERVNRDDYSEAGAAPGPLLVPSTGSGDAAAKEPQGRGRAAPDVGPDSGASPRSDGVTLRLPGFLRSAATAPVPGTPGGSADDSPGGPASPSAPGSSRGELRVSVQHVELGGGSEGSVDLRAHGGPVHWSATAEDACISTSPSAGGMDAGERVTLTVSLDRDAPGCAGSGAGTIGFADDGPSVRVSWSEARAPSPGPTGSGSGSPGRSPTGPSAGTGSS